MFSVITFLVLFFFFSSRRRHTRLQGDWSSDVCSSDLGAAGRDNTSGRAWALGGDGGLRSVRGRTRLLGPFASRWSSTSKTSPARVSREIGRASCRERV